MDAVREDSEVMEPTRFFAIVSWISLPTVMFGGYSLLWLTLRGTLTSYQERFFRAGHAHAGVLLLMSLLYYIYLAQTTLSSGLQWVACAALVVGVLAQSGGFFLHMAVGKEGEWSAGTTVTAGGAVLLAVALLLLAYGLAVA
jgi:hypothetical protein